MTSTQLLRAITIWLEWNGACGRRRNEVLRCFKAEKPKTFQQAWNLLSDDDKRWAVDRVQYTWFRKVPYEVPKEVVADVKRLYHNYIRRVKRKRNSLRST